MNYLPASYFEVVDEQVEELGVELRPTPVPEDLERFLERVGPLVGPLAPQRVEDVGDGDDSGFQRDGVPDQTIGVAVPVESLMMREGDEGAQFEEGRVGTHEHLEAVLGMTLHGEALVFGQQPRVENDRIGDADLADIVQLAGQSEDFSFRSGQAHQGGQSSGVLPYALEVERGLGLGVAPLCRRARRA